MTKYMDKAKFMERLNKMIDKFSDAILREVKDGNYKGARNANNSIKTLEFILNEVDSKYFDIEAPEEQGCIHPAENAEVERLIENVVELQRKLSIRDARIERMQREMSEKDVIIDDLERILERYINSQTRQYNYFPENIPTK